MTDRSNERLKRNAEYKKEYRKQNRDATNEYMRLYRPRKKKEKTPALKPSNIGIDALDDQQCELQQTATLSVPQTSNIDPDQFASKYSTWVSHERDEIYDRYWFSAMKKFESLFDKIQFDVACDVCDRLWPDTSFRPVPAQGIGALRKVFPDEDVTNFKLCSNCEQKIR